jgi:hypothetical protein
MDLADPEGLKPRRIRSEGPFCTPHYPPWAKGRISKSMMSKEGRFWTLLDQKRSPPGYLWLVGLGMLTKMPSWPLHTVALCRYAALCHWATSSYMRLGVPLGLGPALAKASQGPGELQGLGKALYPGIWLDTSI